MCAAMEVFARVLSARAVRFTALNSCETPGSGISDLLPYSSSLTRSSLSTMSKSQLLHRMELHAGNSRSSSTSQGGDGGKGDSKESVWGSKPKTMTKAEFRKRLEKLTAKPKVTAETTVEGISRCSVWRDEHGRFPKTMTKDEFRKRLYLCREGQLAATDGSNGAEEEEQGGRQSVKMATSDCPPSNGEERKKADNGGEEKREGSSASHGLWERLQAIYR